MSEGGRLWPSRNSVILLKKKNDLSIYRLIIRLNKDGHVSDENRESHGVGDEYSS